MRIIAKYILLCFFVSVFLISCKSQKKTFQPMAETIKDFFLENISDVRSIDTIYLIIDTITPQLKTIIQLNEYRWASTEAKNNGNPDSTALRDTSEWLLNQIHTINNSRFLYFRAMPLVIYTNKEMEKVMAEKWLFFDKEFKLVEKYSFIQKKSQTDNNELRLEKFLPFSSNEIHDFEKKGILKYYWKNN